MSPAKKTKPSSKISKDSSVHRMEEEQAKKDEKKRKAEERQREQEEADRKAAQEKADQEREEREKEAAKKKSVPKKPEPTRRMRVEKVGKDWKRPSGRVDNKEKELRDGDLQAGESFFCYFDLLIVIIEPCTTCAQRGRDCYHHVRVKKKRRGKES